MSIITITTLNVLFYIGAMLFGGLLFGRLAKLVGFPNVTGYIVVGLLMGPHVLKILDLQTVDNVYDIVSEMALGFIALFIGAEFKLSFIKEIGIAPIIITLFEGILASVFVTVGLVAIQVDLSIALILGAIASATAPAVTIMIIKQYRANGPLTKTLLSVVALDDALALILFFFAANFALSLQSGALNLFAALVVPLAKIAVSVGFGAAFAFLILIPLRFFKKKSNRMCIIAGTVFVASALSSFLDVSPLMTCMILGGVLVNISREGDSVIELSELMTPVILMLFFVLSGASFDITIIPQVGLMGIMYILARVAGKYLGAYLGAAIMKSPKNVRRYLGFTLVPQAGVAIGLMLISSKMFPGIGSQIRTVILGATLVYELLGSVISKTALSKAGEIPRKPKKEPASAMTSG